MSIEDFRAQILERRPLRIRGGGTKDFYGGPLVGEPLDTTRHAGIVSYEPSELVLTARAGTTMYDIGEVLIENEQYFPAAPPGPGLESTLGGAIASGLCGTYRASRGGIRDYLLGVKIMDGEGRVQTFGGQVMKNVAGFDVSRLMVGSMGTLGLILEATIKVMPLPPCCAERVFKTTQAQALKQMNAWAAQRLPIDATSWYDGYLRVELMGSSAVIDAAVASLGDGVEDHYDEDEFWNRLQAHTLEFFEGEEPLWRLSVPFTTPVIKHDSPMLIEWNGAQRWLRGDIDVVAMRAMAEGLGGHLTRFRGGDPAVPPFQALPPALMKIHRRLKQSLDPNGIFNPGRLYPEF